MDTVTIVLADDHDIVREGIARLLETFGNINVVGQADNGLDAVQLARDIRPDIVILDITMPKMLGVEAIREIRRDSPDSKIIVLSMHNKERYVRDCMINGASAYLLKQSAVHELQNAIDYVLKDQYYLSPVISKGVIQSWLAGSTSRDSGTGILTTREREILKLLAEGNSNRAIAELLHISPKTVETHRHRINEKLELGNITDLVRYALKEGVISVD
jgi:DNA-binding NarL/FixJ family response regulator